MDTVIKECTFYKIFDLIGKKWSLCILHELYKAGGEGMRFNELKRKMETITPKVLSFRLKELEEKNLVERTDISYIPGSVCEYRLTECGRELILAFQPFKSWGLRWLGSKEICARTSCLECEL